MTARSLRSPAPGARRRHGLRIGVDGQEIHAHARDLARRALHRRADVMQLEIDEDALAGVLQVLRQRQPAAIGQLHADLVEGDGVAERRDQRARRLDGLDVEGDDETVAGAGHGLPPWPALR